MVWHVVDVDDALTLSRYLQAVRPAAEFRGTGSWYVPLGPCIAHTPAKGR